MNNIKATFTIQDLEILSGIKAHTIRIWEKRYNILNPERLNRNVRKYGLNDLQKMLNIGALNSSGVKISKIAQLNNQELASEARNLSLKKVNHSVEINQMIVSMYSFDEDLFNEVYIRLIEKSDFTSVFKDSFLPLLTRIGILWQTEALKPSHEHFVSNLIYQKLASNTDAIKKHSSEDDHIYVLFLPKGEIHELGLLFLNYYLKSIGKRTLYLGRDIPLENLSDLNSQFGEISWVCHFVIDQPQEQKNQYITRLSELLINTNNNASILGRTKGLESSEFKNKRLKVYSELQHYLETLQ